MEVVVLFLKAPVPGTVKTRLAVSLGKDGALAAYRQLVEFLLKGLGGGRVHVHFTPDDPEPLRSWLGDRYVYRPQVGPDLGARLNHAMETEFAAGAGKLVFLGGDCPYVNRQRLEEAFSALDRHPVVLGPATDGGYYLLGVNRVLPELFEGIAWGTASVFPSTLELCRKHSLGVALLPEESDVDDFEDWQRARAFMANA